MNNILNKRFYNLIKIILISLSVFLITLLICSFKKDLFIDEMLSYGLANNKMLPESKDYVSYTGEQLLLDYTAVKNGKQFDFINLINNQKNDTHPPFWYILLNIICSLNVGKWSMWYGLIINVFLSVVIFWELKWIYKKLVDDNVIAVILAYLTIFTKAMISSFIFIRMYTLLIAFSLLFYMLIIDDLFYNNNQILNNNIKSKFSVRCILFYLSLYILIVLGTLTHYHFLILGGVIGIIFCIYLIIRKQIIKLIITTLTAAFGLLSAYLFFPFIMNHLFFAKDLHKIETRDSVTILRNVSNFAKYIYEDVFSYSIFVYLLILVIIVFLAINKYKSDKKNPNKQINNSIFNDFTSNIKLNIYFITIILLLIYYILLIITIKFEGDRYLFNWFPLFLVIIYSGFYNLIKKVLPNYRFLTFGLIIITVICSNVKSHNLMYESRDSIIEYFEKNTDKKMLICYEGGRKWELVDTFNLFKNMKDVTIVKADIPGFQRFGDFNNNTDFFLVVLPKLSVKQVLNEVASVNDVNSYEEIVKNQEYIIYRLFKQ